MTSEQVTLQIHRALELATQHHQAGRLAEAQQIYRQVLTANPEDADALHFLGLSEHQLGAPDIAVGLIEKARRLRPADPLVLNHLGCVYSALDRQEEAEKCLRRALVLKPDFFEAHNNLGNALVGLGRLKDAEQSFRRALALNADYANAHINLATLLERSGETDKAEHHFRRAISLNPDIAEAHNNLGNLLHHSGRLDEAERSFGQALALRPNYVDAQSNLANTLLESGRIEEAIEGYRRAVAIKPESMVSCSNLLWALNYVPGKDAADVFLEHKEVARRLFSGVERKAHCNVRDAERRLRVGYVSGDLRNHPVGRFMAPVLARHNHERLEVFCYSNCAAADAETRRLERYADRWREVFALGDEELAELIRRDAIDILVDLSGHTAGNRLSVFARKPAPVQVTWLGYLNTTGMAEVDYRVTDSRASPEGLFDAFHTERLVRLPDSQWCYEAPAECPDVSNPPSSRAGFVTFASFSNLAKIGLPVIELWSRLLARVPDSRLLIVRRGVTSIRKEFLARFTRYGVDPRRLDLQDSVPFRDYLALHGLADVVLDTFPYAGGTTTCHALWMGVPVVSLVGSTATSRGGASLLHAIGLDELVANTPDEYLEIAATLAGDPRRLAELRTGMRGRMAGSPLMDAERFTRNLEGAYRSMWRSWCAKK